MKRFLLLASLIALITQSATAATKPNIIFVMADDMGWGQTGYRNHPVLKTPNLDAMAANGLRFDRFYAGGPVCSPTRASVLTGRTHDRTGVLSHGYALRHQEKTLPQSLREAGYTTGHFGKWHLNGHRGPGAPILSEDTRNPGTFGFDEWVSVSNFYDVDPLMSRQGKIEQFKGDSSEIVVDEAAKFLEKHHRGGKPMFAIIWYGTPHSPFKALDQDKAAFASLNEASANHYGELVAMDRSIGTLRKKLRDLKIEKDTMLVFCSDNGGLPGIVPETVGGLRGNKGTVYEGGLRVPGIIEWPGTIKPRITQFPAGVVDYFPTVVDIVGLPKSTMLKPVDGISLKPLFSKELTSRPQPLGFHYQGKAALIDNNIKIIATSIQKGTYELYDLEKDTKEAKDLSSTQPDLFAKMKQKLTAWNASVDASFAGKDYPEGKVSPPDPEPVSWYETPAYQPYLTEWKERWEFRSYIDRQDKAGKNKKKKKGADE